MIKGHLPTLDAELLIITFTIVLLLLGITIVFLFLQMVKQYKKIVVLHNELLKSKKE